MLCMLSLLALAHARPEYEAGIGDFQCQCQPRSHDSVLYGLGGSSVPFDT